MTLDSESERGKDTSSDEDNERYINSNENGNFWEEFWKR